MKKYSFSDLVQIMADLRSPNGCPWDKEQTFNSLLPYLIEESHEYIDAVNAHDVQEMCEELGDILLQVVFHAQVAKEEQKFNIEDVIHGIAEKMVVRHPHVFGESSVDTSAEVLLQWEKIKSGEKGKKSRESVLDGIAKSLPSLSEAYLMQKKAAKQGFDWDDAEGALDKIREETEEVAEELKAEQIHEGALEEEIGDLLFSVVNLARKAGVEPELALRTANQKFSRRFREVEAKATPDMKQFSLAELDQFWNEIKSAEK